MKPAKVHMAGNLQNESICDQHFVFLCQFWLTFKLFIHGNLDGTCQGRVKGV